MAMAEDKSEFEYVINSIARDENIPSDYIIKAVEAAMAAASAKSFGNFNIRAKFDLKTGETKLFRERQVVDNVEDEATEVSLGDAKHVEDSIAIGETLVEPLPPVVSGRNALGIVRGVIKGEIDRAKRERQFNEFASKSQTIIYGLIKRTEMSGVVIDLGPGTEALLPKHKLIPNESPKQGDRIRTYIEDVRRVDKGPQIFLSRTHNAFLAELFKQEVPEIYDGIITIKAVSREPGSRAKMAVYSSDPSIDPVGSCVGVRGSRVQAVISELQGEKIDIIPWSQDIATFAVNALAPADIAKVVIDEEDHRLEVVVPTNQLSIAIGRRGQNVRLASQLIGWHVDILTEEEESKRRLDEFNKISQFFMKALDIEEMMAQLLATEGFTSVQDLLDVTIDELARIEGFDEGLAEALQDRARYYAENHIETLEEACDRLKLEASISELPHLSVDILEILREKGIKTREDIADLSHDELEEFLPEKTLKGEQIDAMIMKARALEYEKSPEA